MILRQCPWPSVTSFFRVLLTLSIIGFENDCSTAFLDSFFKSPESSYRFSRAFFVWKSFENLCNLE